MGDVMAKTMSYYIIISKLPRIQRDAGMAVCGMGITLFTFAFKLKPTTVIVTSLILWLTISAINIRSLAGLMIEVIL